MVNARHDLEDNLILLGLSGSRLYGTHTEESDYDYVGIATPPMKYLLGFTRIEQVDSFTQPGNGFYTYLDNTDSKIYALNKFFNLALKNNPNVLELLYLPEYLVLTNKGKILIDHRQLFLSSKVVHSYSGYAYAQLRKVKTHREWLLKYQKNPNFFNERPKLIDYLGEDNPLTKEEVHSVNYFLHTLVKDYAQYSEVAEYFIEKVDLKEHLNNFHWPEELNPYIQKFTRASNDFLTLVHKTHLYNKACKEYNEYTLWKQNRNSKRGEIEAICGYDGKHLSHCVRLLTMGIEILTKGKVIPCRTNIDADYLKAIRFGQVSYDSVLEYTESLFPKIKEVGNNTKLPKFPDFSTLEPLLISLSLF